MRISVGFKFANSTCQNPRTVPLAIQARVNGSRIPFNHTDDTLVVNPIFGLHCYNRDQVDGQCEDYEVRFCCYSEFYACESDGTKDLQCHQFGEVIKIQNAFYGRKRVNVCERKVAYNCVAEGSEDTIKQLCDGREQCQINPSTNVFGDDPCPGIPKYVEIQYACVAEGESEENYETDGRV